MKQTYRANGATWSYHEETEHDWETWEISAGATDIRVRRIDPNTKLIPAGFNPTEWEPSYDVEYWDEEFTEGGFSLPIDTPLDEVLARAIVEARMA